MENSARELIVERSLQINLASPVPAPAEPLGDPRSSCGSSRYLSSSDLDILRVGARILAVCASRGVRGADRLCAAVTEVVDRPEGLGPGRGIALSARICGVIEQLTEGANTGYWKEIIHGDSDFSSRLAITLAFERRAEIAALNALRDVLSLNNMAAASNESTGELASEFSYSA